MGLLVNGEWVDQWYDTKKHGGEFVRESAQLRDWVGSSEESQGDSYPA
ncbi:MAG TPA: glutathione-dependent reductase, partial [Halomonas sp.]|nr:glutathione-dependent reductase [Halomonas sp.]